MNVETDYDIVLDYYRNHLDSQSNRDMMFDSMFERSLSEPFEEKLISAVG